MTHIPLSVVTLLAAAGTCALLGGFATFAMIGEINRKLSEHDQVSYLGGSYSKFDYVLREYKRQYPKGRLDSVFMLLVALMFLFLVAGALLAVYLS